MSSRLFRVSIRVADGLVEEARARILPHAPAGFEEVEGDGWVELAVYTESEGEAALRAAFPDAASTLIEPGWEDRWRVFHRPVRAGGLWIGPSWEEAPVGESAVVVDPGLAFGTGAHPTTRACIELLAASPRGSVLDAGCGSGVIAVAAARLGFSPVFAVDADDVAVGTATETARRNGVVVEVSRADVLADPLPAADLVIANIELGVVERLLARRPAPRMITSGYLARESASAEGWELVARMEVDGWAAERFSS